MTNPLDYCLAPRPQMREFDHHLSAQCRGRLIVGEHLKRLRPLDMKVVRQLRESIREAGVIEPVITTFPISTAPRPVNYDALSMREKEAVREREKAGLRQILIAGHHRWAALCMLWDDLPEAEALAFVMPVRCMAVAQEHYETISMTENLKRSEVTPEQHKVQAARLKVLLQKKG